MHRTPNAEQKVLLEVSAAKEAEVVDAVIEAMATGQLDFRWASIARTHFEQGFMALNRAIMEKRYA